MTINRFLNRARGQGNEKPKTEPLRYCILLPDSTVQSNEQGPVIYTDVELLKEACQAAGVIASTVEATELIVKQADELVELRDRAASLQIQIDRAVQHSNLVAGKSVQLVKERDDALRRIGSLESAVQFAVERLHHSYNGAPNGLEKDTHGWIRRAAIELRDALKRKP